MRPRSSSALAGLAVSAAAWMALSGAAWSKPAPQHELPQSITLEHADTLGRLKVLARRPGAVGVQARKALTLFERHVAREEAYILPPLSLLPDLADGKVTPDMRWALVMADRVKANRDMIFEEHSEVTDALNALRTAGLRAHDKAAVDFAQAAAADSLNDTEIMEPTVVLIGDYLRSRLPPGQ